MTTPWNIELVRLLDELIELVRRPETDVSDTYFNSKEQVIEQLSASKRRAKIGDPTVIGSLSTLFAPTMEFQDISISSGWADEFLDLAARFDKIAERSVGTMTWKHWTALVLTGLVGLAILKLVSWV